MAVSDNQIYLCNFDQNKLEGLCSTVNLSDLADEGHSTAGVAAATPSSQISQHLAAAGLIHLLSAPCPVLLRTITGTTTNTVTGSKFLTGIHKITTKHDCILV